MGSQIFQPSKSITSTTRIFDDASGLSFIDSISKSSFNSLYFFGGKVDFTTSSRGIRLIYSTLPAGWNGLHSVFAMIHNFTLGTEDSLMSIQLYS